MAKSNPNSKWFSNPPIGRDTSKVEDAVCRALLRWAGVPVGVFARAAGTAPSDRITFTAMADVTAFPVIPAVTEVDPGPVSPLLTAFAKSPLLAAWEAAGFMPGEESALVFRSADWPMYVLRRPNRIMAIPRPHLAVVHPAGHFLVIEPVTAWAEVLGWTGGDLASEPLASE